MARQSISRIFTALAEADPGRIIVSDDRDTMTAGGLESASNRLARAYLALGVGRDSLVSVTLPNSIEMVVVCVAVWKCGATPQPVGSGLGAEERAELEELTRPALGVGVPASDPGTAWVPAGYEPAGALSDAVLPAVWASSWKAPTSSGSTGRPKVVVATAPALLDAARPVAVFLPADQVQLVSGPLTHSATFTYAFRGLMTGHRLVILPRFDERRVLAAVEEHSVTWALLVPTMLHRLLRLPEADIARADVSSLRTVLHMGAPCAPDLKRRVIDWLGAERVVEVYAGSESNGLTMIRGDEWLEHPGSVGRPIGGTEVAVRDPDGVGVPHGAEGRIWMRRGADVGYRYIGASSPRTAEGWDTIGDLGRVDDQGYLYVTDRVDDVILRGSVNVHPVEVERVLESHPAVRGAVAFGVPDTELGQRIEAVADVADGSVTGSELQEWVAGLLDPARRPAVVHIGRGPVRDDAGKVNRRSLSQRYGPGHDE
jgi:bile acid-coenzyme A ligase